jgi:hypothetical protein
MAQPTAGKPFIAINISLRSQGSSGIGAVRSRARRLTGAQSTPRALEQSEGGTLFWRIAICHRIRDAAARAIDDILSSRWHQPINMCDHRIPIKTRATGQTRTTMRICFRLNVIRIRRAP